MPVLKYWQKRFIGKRFGRLIVLSYSHQKEFSSGYRRIWWRCICDCGNEAIVRSDNLTRGKTKSCGCLSDEYNNSKRGYRTPIGKSSFNKLFHNYKSSAKSRKLVFEITKDEFLELTQKPCHYCGSVPSSFYDVKGSNGGFSYNGIDRINSSEGYIHGNIVSCCGFCNRAKLNKNETEFRMWIKRLVEFNIVNVKETIYANG